MMNATHCCNENKKLKLFYLLTKLLCKKDSVYTLENLENLFVEYCNKYKEPQNTLTISSILKKNVVMMPTGYAEEVIEYVHGIYEKDFTGNDVIELLKTHKNEKVTIVILKGAR